MSATLFNDVARALAGDVSIVPQNYATAGDKDGDAIDMQLSDSAISALVMTGDCGDANTNFYVKLQESDDGVNSFTDVADSTSATYTGATAGDKIFVAVTTNKRTKRYVRARVTIATTGTADVDIAVGILGRLKIIGTEGGTYTTIT